MMKVRHGKCQELHSECYWSETARLKGDLIREVAGL